MALSIRNEKAESLVRTLAKHSGLSMTDAITIAVEEKLARDGQLREAEILSRRAAIREIQERVAKLPVINPEVNADDWMYDENGLPH